MDHEMKQQPKGYANGQHRFEDDFNTIMVPTSTAPPVTRYSSSETSNQVQFQFNPNRQSNNNNIEQEHGIYTVQCQRKKLSSTLCNPVVILSAVSLIAVAGALFSTFYLIHSLKPATTFMDNVNGVIKSKEMQEVDSTVNSFLKNATNWVKQNIGGKNSTENSNKPKKRGEINLFGEGNGFSLNSLANLAGQIIKSVNDTISSIANKTNTAKGIEGGSRQQSLIEKSAISTREGSESKARLIQPSSSEPELDSGQKVYHMS